MKTKQYDPAGRLGLICHAEDDGSTVEHGGGSADASPTIAELQERINILEGKSSKVLDEKKSEQAKRRELEAKLQEYEQKQKLAEEERAKKAGEFDKLAAEKEAEAKAAIERANSLQKRMALQSALAQAAIADPFRDAVSAMFEGKLDIDGENVLLDGKDVSEALKEWAQTDQGKHFVKSETVGGGASGGGGKGNGKTMPRAQFDKLGPMEKATFIRDHGVVVDA